MEFLNVEKSSADWPAATCAQIAKPACSTASKGISRWLNGSRNVRKGIVALAHHEKQEDHHEICDLGHRVRQRVDHHLDRWEEPCRADDRGLDLGGQRSKNEKQCVETRISRSKREWQGHLHCLSLVLPLPFPCASTAFAAKTLPLSCASTAYLAPVATMILSTRTIESMPAKMR